MIEIIKELKIEVSKPNIFQAVVAKQYDMNTRFIKATLVDGADVIYIPNDPDKSVKVVINAERPDGTKGAYEGEVNDDGTVTVPLHSWMLELDGTVICDISVIDTEANDNKKLTTTSFTLLVEKAAYGGGEINDDPQYDVLVSLLETCSEASAVAQEALDKSNEANAKYDACVEATTKANEAADNANAVREEVEAGGFIKSLQEVNKGGKFSVWIGTQAEYEVLEEKLNNCLYMVTDDNTAEELTAKFVEVNERIETLETDYIVEQGTSGIWFYRKWASGIIECWGKAVGRTAPNNETAPYPHNDIDLPCTFVTTECANIQASDSAKNGWKVGRIVANIYDNTNVLKFDALSTNNATDENIDFLISVKGTWK